MPDAAANGHALLELENAACERGGRLLWRKLSLRIMAGEALHLTGGNGCGKSSLLRLAAGLLPPFAGRLERAVPAGLVDEAPALDRELPLGRALGFWAGLSATPLSVAEALSATGIAHLADVPVRILSNGQRKRASLARLLIENRRLWLLDEPANGLDSDGLAMLLRLIAAHRDAGGGVLFASHQPLALPGVNCLGLPDYAA
jgi:heme exporter protein A